MKVIWLMVLEKDMVFLILTMEMFMKVNFLEINSMVKEFINGQMEIIMKENLLMEKSMVMVT